MLELSWQGTQFWYGHFKDHGVITPIFHAGVQQILYATGAQARWDEEQKYWHSPRGEYELKSIAYTIPGSKQILTHMDHMREMDNTLDLYGMGYDDIGYMSKTIGAYNSAAGMAWNYVSRNLDVLYE